MISLFTSQDWPKCDTEAYTVTICPIVCKQMERMILQCFDRQNEFTGLNFSNRYLFFEGFGCRLLFLSDEDKLTIGLIKLTLNWRKRTMSSQNLNAPLNVHVYRITKTYILEVGKVILFIHSPFHIHSLFHCWDHWKLVTFFGIVNLAVICDILSYNLLTFHAFVSFRNWHGYMTLKSLQFSSIACCMEKTCI